MKKFYLLALVGIFVSATKIHAYDFTAPDVNGNTIYYSIVTDSISVLSRGMVENEYHYFKIEGNCVSVVSNGGNYSGNLVIPSQVTNPNSNNVYKVVSIADNAFSSCSDLLSVNIHEGVILIGTYAFQSCSLLSTVKIPNSVLFIGHDAFVYCSKLSSVNLPQLLPSIENGLFNRCYSLTEIALPLSVRKIKGHAFYSCTGLTSFYAHKNVECIDYNSFEGCTNLKEVFLANVDSIGSGAFMGCNNLSIAYISAKIPSSLGSYAFDYGRDTLFVPSGSVNVYETSSWTNYFNHIIGITFGESEVDSITTTTATLKWLPDSTVTQYDINVYTGGAHFAQYLVDSNGQIISSQLFAPSIYHHKLDTTTSSTEYFVISLDGLSAGTDYNYTIDGRGEDPQSAPIYHEEGAFTTLNEGEEGFILPFADDPRKKATKLLRDGMLLIEQNGRIYNLHGTEIQTQNQ